MTLTLKDYVKLNQKELIEILHIRNENYIKENMINVQTIGIEEHLSWVKSLKNQNYMKYFAVFSENEIIGSLSFVIREKKLNWGVFFKEKTNPFLSSASTFIFLEYLFLNQTQIYSCVKKRNMKALNFNKNFGFKIYAEDEDYYYLNLRDSFWQEHKKTRLLKPIKNYLDKIKYHFE